MPASKQHCSEDILRLVYALLERERKPSLLKYDETIQIN